MAGTSTVFPPNHEVPQVMFSWLDYLLFSGMLGMSALIGIYFGFFGKKQDNAKEYLLGGKTMKVVPVALSLVASHTSGIALLSVPADIYIHGGNYIWICIAIVLTSAIGWYAYIPVFLKLQLTSTYEYLNMRFNNRIRIMASVLYTVSVMLYNPIVIYVPALAFAQASGINLHLITPIVCIICIFYTTIGGLKAVVWTDSLQAISIAICMIVVFFMGIASTGGFFTIIDRSLEGHRLDIFQFQLDPTVRDGFWALAIGSAFTWMSHFCVSQGTIQRFMAVPSKQQAKGVVLVFCIGVVFVKLVSSITGLIIYAKYFDCDPLSTKQILRTDQLLPYYVMDVAGKIPGLPGLFIAGVFSAGLSTLSTTMNTLSGVIYQDFIRPFLPDDITQKQTSNVLKLIVVIVGALSTALVFVVEHLGGVLPLVVSVGGITGGPLLGLFTLGMMFPIANTKGAMSGGIFGLAFSSWIVLGNQWYKHSGAITDPGNPLSTEGCGFVVNVTLPVDPSPMEQPFVLYRITFWYYTLMGTAVVIIVGLIVSWFTCRDDPPVHPDLISPVAQFLLPKEKTGLKLHPYLSVDKALHLISINSEKEKEAAIN